MHSDGVTNTCAIRASLFGLRNGLTPISSVRMFKLSERITGMIGLGDKALTAVVGKKIRELSIVENRLAFIFDDESTLSIFDARQACCERRYMSTDDELSWYVGAILLDAEVRDGPTQQQRDEFGYDNIESQFLIVTTSKGQSTIVNYNEHNGFYGGFLIDAVAVVNNSVVRV